MMLTKVTWDGVVRHCLQLTNQKTCNGPWRSLCSVISPDCLHQHHHTNSVSQYGGASRSVSQTLLSAGRVRTLHKLVGQSILCTGNHASSQTVLCTGDNAARLVPVQSFRTSTGLQVIHTSRAGGHQEKGPKQKMISSDSGMMLYLAAENAYLSWMRNTYIMTVALVGLINLDLGPLAPTVCTASSLTAIFNMVVGSSGFIFNLANIRRRGHISRLKCTLSQLGVLVHFMFWFTVLVLLLVEFTVEYDRRHEDDDILSEEDSAKVI